MNELLPISRSERVTKRRLAAIAFLDVVGYSRMMGDSEEATLSAWGRLRNTVIEPRIVAWRGRVVDRAGDGIFAEFGSALDALKWAIDVQGATHRHPHVGEAIQVRIALHLADVIDGLDGSVQGDGVNIAARLQSVAEPGGIVVSRAIVDAVAGKTDAAFADLGGLELKNISRPIHAYRLGDGLNSAIASPKSKNNARIALSAVGIAAVACALVFAVSAWRVNPREQAEKFVQRGSAVSCPEFPCPQAWLARRALFEEAIATDPTFAKAYALDVFTYTDFVSAHISVDEADDLRSAARLATKAVVLAPDLALAHEARGAVLRQDPARLEDALTAYLRAIALDPKRAPTRGNAGLMFLLLGRPAEAETYLQSALATAPNHPFAPTWLKNLGIAELFLDREGHGADHFRRSIAAQSHGAATVDVELERSIDLASALALNGDLDAARSLIDGLRGPNPGLSTRNLFSNCDCSHAAGFLAGVAKLKQGAIMAGVRDAG